MQREGASRRWRHLAAITGLLLATTACTAGHRSGSFVAASDPPSATAAGVATSIPSPSATLAAAPPTTPPALEPATSALPATPPAATAHGINGAVAGDLGSFSWREGGSASPWIPGNGPVHVTQRDGLTVSLTPDVAVTAWTARAAAPGTAGEPVVAALTGRAAPARIRLDLPPGTWELGVEIQFGDLGSAIYYWTLEVAA